MMKHYPQYLSFEVTRKCNLKCSHCMRGEAQNLDMSKELVDKVLDDIYEIHYLSFTGGEPVLNIELIKYVISELQRRHIAVYGFDIVSNGKDKVLLAELCHILDEFNSYCTGCAKDASRLAISCDEYHSKESLPVGDYSFTIMYKGENVGDKAEFLNLGRARNLVGKEKEDKDVPDVFKYRGDTTYHMDFTSIVVSADGTVRLTVDYEYESIKGVVGNLADNSLTDILSKISLTEQEYDKYCHEKYMSVFKKHRGIAQLVRASASSPVIPIKKNL